MKRSDIQIDLGYYKTYVELVDDLSLTDAFEKYLAEIQSLNKEILNQLEGKIYAPEKWTVKEILQHLIDWERIFSYRALVYARNDGGITAGHDQDLMATNSNANSKPLEKILNDFIAARKSTISLFRSFDEVDLLRLGENFNMKMSPLAMGFVILGHQIHHFNVIKERYLPLLEKDFSLFN